jgi:dipeptidyl-peptidase-4
LNSTKLFRRLQDLGKPFDVMVYPGGKHGLMRQHDGRHGYATMLRFFNSSLMPSEAPGADAPGAGAPRAAAAPP